MTKYRSGERYEDLATILRSEGRWSELSQSEALPPGEVNECFEKPLQLAALHRDDEAAARYVRWSLNAIDDFLLSDHLEANGSRLVIKTGGEAGAALSGLGEARALRAVEIWASLPVACLTPAQHVRNIHGTWSKPKVVVVENQNFVETERTALKETKKLLLQEITCQWRETRDEAEAERLFEVIAESGKKILPDAWEMVETIVREATSTGFPVRRLMRCYMRLASRPDYWDCGLEDRLCRIMAVGWARSIPRGDMSRAFEVLLPLPLASDRHDPDFPVQRLVGEVARNVAELDEKTRTLRERLSKRTIPAEWPRSCRLSTSFRYDSPISITITDTFTLEFVQKIPTEDLHGWLGGLKRAARQWRREHPEVEVTVATVSVIESGKKRTEVFRWEEAVQE